MGIANTVAFTEFNGIVPGFLGGGEKFRRNELLVDLGHFSAVHPQDVLHGLAIGVVAGEGSHAGRRAGRGGIGVSGHEGGDRTRPGPAFIGVVGKTLRHQKGTDVGVAETELAVAPGVLGDRLCRVVGVADEDLLGRKDDLHRGGEAVGVEGTVFTEVLEEVDRGQIAGGVVEVHVLTAIADHDAVDHIGVVPGLGQVVGELDAIVGPLHQSGRAADVVKALDAAESHFAEQSLLATQGEADVLGETGDRPRGDAEVIHGKAAVVADAAVLGRVGERTHVAGTAGLVDAAGDAEGGEELLDPPE